MSWAIEGRKMCVSCRTVKQPLDFENIHLSEICIECLYKEHHEYKQCTQCGYDRLYKMFLNMNYGKGDLCFECRPALKKPHWKAGRGNTVHYQKYMQGVTYG